MFILHVKCNFDQNFKDLLSHSNIFDERFFFLLPDRRPFFNQNGTRQGPHPFNFNGQLIDYSFHLAVCKGEIFFYTLVFSPWKLMEN